MNNYVQHYDLNVSTYVRPLTRSFEQEIVLHERMTIHTIIYNLHKVRIPKFATDINGLYLGTYKSHIRFEKFCGKP